HLLLLLRRRRRPEIVEDERHRNEEDEQRERAPSRAEPENDRDASEQLERGGDREQEPGNPLAGGVARDALPSLELVQRAQDEDRAERDAPDELRPFRDAIHVPP